MIFLVNGVPGSGKTTIARSLAARFPFGFHLEVDRLRSSVVSGIALPFDWNEETDRQFALAHRAAAEVARVYFEAGFTVALDHCANPLRIRADVDPYLQGLPVRRILLNPPVEVALARNHARDTKSFDPAVLEDIIRGCAEGFPPQAAQVGGWEVFDNGSETVEETVSRILS